MLSFIDLSKQKNSDEKYDVMHHIHIYTCSVYLRNSDSYTLVKYPTVYQHMRNFETK
jgi:hypothetical protein